MGLADRDYSKADRWQREQRERLAAWQSREFRGPWRNASRRRRLAGYAIVASVVAVPAAGIGYAAGANVGPFAPKPVLVWSGVEFNSKSEFQTWLRGRGLSYGQWAARHPAAAAKLERRP